MSDYKDRQIHYILLLKDSLDKCGFIPHYEAELILSAYASSIIYGDNLYKQLQHALETGGEYLHIEEMYH